MYYREDKIYNMPTRITITITVMKFCLVIALIFTSLFVAKKENEMRIKTKSEVNRIDPVKEQMRKSYLIRHLKIKDNI